MPLRFINRNANWNGAISVRWSPAACPASPPSAAWPPGPWRGSAMRKASSIWGRRAAHSLFDAPGATPRLSAAIRPSPCAGRRLRHLGRCSSIQARYRVTRWPSSARASARPRAGECVHRARDVIDLRGGHAFDFGLGISRCGPGGNGNRPARPRWRRCGPRRTRIVAELQVGQPAHPSRRSPGCAGFGRGTNGSSLLTSSWAWKTNASSRVSSAPACGGSPRSPRGAGPFGQAALGADARHRPTDRATFSHALVDLDLAGFFVVLGTSQRNLLGRWCVPILAAPWASDRLRSGNRPVDADREASGGLRHEHASPMDDGKNRFRAEAGSVGVASSAPPASSAASTSSLLSSVARCCRRHRGGTRNPVKYQRDGACDRTLVGEPRFVTRSDQVELEGFVELAPARRRVSCRVSRIRLSGPDRVGRGLEAWWEAGPIPCRKSLGNVCLHSRSYQIGHSAVSRHVFEASRFFLTVTIL